MKPGRKLRIAYYKILNYFGINWKCVCCDSSDTDGYYLCGICEVDLFNQWADGDIIGQLGCKYNGGYGCKHPEKIEYDLYCGECLDECPRYMEFHDYLFSNKGYDLVIPYLWQKRLSKRTLTANKRKTA